MAAQRTLLPRFAIPTSDWNRLKSVLVRIGSNVPKSVAYGDNGSLGLAQQIVQVVKRIAERIIVWHADSLGNDRHARWPPA